MKLSEIKGERALDVIADIIEPVANIAMDEVASDIFNKKECPEGTDTTTFVVERLKKSIPALIKGHKTDLVTILATINDVTADEYTENMTIVSLIKDSIDLVSDDAFTELFT